MLDWWGQPFVVEKRKKSQKINVFPKKSYPSNSVFGKVMVSLLSEADSNGRLNYAAAQAVHAAETWMLPVAAKLLSKGLCANEILWPSVDSCNPLAGVWSAAPYHSWASDKPSPILRTVLQRAQFSLGLSQPPHCRSPNWLSHLAGHQFVAC